MTLQLPVFQAGATFGCVVMCPQDLRGQTITATLRYELEAVDMAAEIVPPEYIYPWRKAYEAMGYTFLDISLSASESSLLPRGRGLIDIRAQTADGKVCRVPPIYLNIESDPST